MYVQNIKEHDAYYAALRAGRLPVFRGVSLQRDDLIRRHIITQLMCNFHLDIRDVERRFGLDFEREFAPELGSLAASERDGFVKVTRETITVTPLGRVFIRNLCMTFDRYLAKGHDKPVFSRTI
jgi:oxygen-independent coproporphyrinogen-3 oxidase